MKIPSGTTRFASIGCPFRFKWMFKKKRRRRERSCSAHRKQTYRRGKPCGFKGADMWTGCRYSLSPLAAAASRFAPTTPTCFLSIKPTATASHRPGTSARGRSREIIAERSGIAASTSRSPGLREK